MTPARQKGATYEEGAVDLILDAADRFHYCAREVALPGDRRGLRVPLVRDVHPVPGGDDPVHAALRRREPKAVGVVAAVADEELEHAPLIGAGGTLFCATFEPRSAVRIGDPVEVTLDVDRLHFFDPEAEAALTNGE